MNNKPPLDPREVRWTTPVLSLVGEHSFSRETVIYSLTLRYGARTWSQEIRAERDPEHLETWHCPAEKLARAMNKLSERLEQYAVYDKDAQS